MKYFETLKKVVLIADRLQKCREIDFTNLKIWVNIQIEKSEELMYALDVLLIPYVKFRSKMIDSSNEEVKDYIEPINLTVGCEVELILFYFLSLVVKEIYSEEIDIYIIYANKPEGIKNHIFFGSHMIECGFTTNISRPINANEIINLDINIIDWLYVSKLFPNVLFNKNGLLEIDYSYGETEADYFDYSGSRDYERDNYNALTDGQYRSYDDWFDESGDYDSLRDSLGH